MWYWVDNNIVKRFDGKTMAVVGFEVDQVFKGETDVSVPINVAYNHHFEREMLGKQQAESPE